MTKQQINCNMKSVPGIFKRRLSQKVKMDCDREIWGLIQFDKPRFIYYMHLYF